MMTVTSVAPEPLNSTGWRSWPWRSLIFLHLIFLAANVSSDNIPYPMNEEVPTVDRLLAASASGQGGRRVAYIVLGVVAIYGLWYIDRNRLKIRGLLGYLMLAFFGLATVSFLWADDVVFTSRKILIFVLLWIGATWVAARLSPINLVRFGFLSTFLTLLTCLAIEIGFARFRPWESDYRFSGYFHPNETGQCLMVTIMGGIALAGREARTKVSMRYLAIAIAGVGFLLLTRSRTALISTICGLAAYWAVVALKERRAAKALWITAGIAVTVFCIYYIFVSPDLGGKIGSSIMMGRTDSDISTLTERTPLWKALIKYYISARPVLGYGYGAFWGDPKHLIAMSLLRKGSVYYHSHSGYLEMALSIGIIGAVIHVVTLLMGIYWLIKGYLRLGDEGYAFGAALVVTLMVSMFTETTNMSTYLAPTFLDMAYLMHAAFIRQPGEVEAPQPIPVRPTVYHLSASL